MSQTDAQKAAGRRYDAKRRDVRARAWQCVVYPDSAPDGWVDTLRDLQVEALVSPLHDQDRQEEDPDKPKKPHHHVIISWKNPVIYTKATEIFDTIGGVYPDPEKAKATFFRQCRVRNFQQAARYLCHLDQPNKHQYNIADVVSIGAIDYQNLVATRAEDDVVVDEIIDFIYDNDITNFMTFLRAMRLMHPEWKRIIYHQHSGLFDRAIKGMRELDYYGTPNVSVENDNKEGVSTSEAEDGAPQAPAAGEV